jgi:acyl-CoA thioester hydrolase
MQKPSVYQRKIHVYETDLMGIVHHSNYLRFCEEARVSWFEKRGLGVSTTDDVFGLVVLETRVKHKLPIRFGDPLQIEVQVKAEGPRLIMQYRLSNGAEKVFATAETSHCRIDQKFKVLRLDPKIIETLESERWIATWL